MLAVSVVKLDEVSCSLFIILHVSASLVDLTGLIGVLGGLEQCKGRVKRDSGEQVYSISYISHSSARSLCRESR